MMDIDPFRFFLELQLALPRNGPGSARATAEAFALLPSLPPRPLILDPGCGQAPEAFDLLKLCDARITAVDLFEPFLDKASARAEREGISQERLAFERADMADMPFDDESFDLIWSEGAIYIVGFEEGLSLWRRFLKPGGFAVVSELTWLTDKPSPIAASFWGSNYPTMGTIETNKAAAVRAGYRVIAAVVLRLEDWWTDYYTPMRAELRAMRARYGDLPALDEMAQEIEVLERSPGDYSYVFYALERA
ncbi:MAG: class I SAM-dependent methyltransferase [Parvibaculum sp.]|uniref:class I SAM-dependent methyltransferase n=1 Tax=Parvibaculum sp. TaxID=2024848 RepID=UPI003C729529